MLRKEILLVVAILLTATFSACEKSKSAARASGQITIKVFSKFTRSAQWAGTY
ncbi:MAG: hypothetical protein LBH85_05900 [Treponema sp.]|jgi:hypothetical protein|nr:hypothetical protein [Treponema sp.]